MDNIYPQTLLIWIITLIHIVIILFIWFGIFLIPQKYKYIYILINILIVLHWKLLKGECILSYLEKKLENPNYKLGYDKKKSYSWTIIQYLINITPTDKTLNNLRNLHTTIRLSMLIYAFADQILIYNLLNISNNYRIIIFITSVILSLTYK